MSRKRAESLKSLSLPSATRPQTEKEMAAMHNYRESGILLLSLTQSRQAWTSSILKKFSSKQDVVYHPVLPENSCQVANVSLLGKCHITIGPHTFYDTKIYEAVYEKDTKNIEFQSGSSQSQTNSQFPTLIQTTSHPHVQLNNNTQSVVATPSLSNLQTLPTKVNSYSATSRPIQPAIQPRPLSQSPQLQVPIQPRVVIPRIPTRSTPSNSIIPSSTVPILSNSIISSSISSSTTPTSSNLSIPSSISSFTPFSTAPISSNVNVQSINALVPTNTSLSTNGNVQNGPRTIPSPNLPANSQLTTLMQTVLQTVNPTQILAIQEHLRQPQAATHMTQEQKNALISQLSTIHQLLTTSQLVQQQSQQQQQQQQQLLQLQQIHSRSQSQVPRSRQIVRYEVLLEFKENKNDKWLFPKETILEALSMSEPYDVLASFYLPQNDEPTSGKQIHQPVTIHLTNLTQATWDALQKATNDVASVIQSMATKMNTKPPRVYLQHCLPCDYPEELLEAIGQKVSKLDGTLIIDTITSPKEKKRKKEDKEKDVEVEVFIETRNKDIKDGKDIDTEALEISETRATKKIKPTKNTEGGRTTPRVSTSNAPKKSKSVPNLTVSSSGGNKRCAYCFCKTTPMWRRGPDGAGTLCNACGVKWKQGKILQGPNASRTAEGDANNAASSSKSRKYSFSAASSAKAKKKSGRSLSMSEGSGALTYIGNDDGREKVSETSGGGFTNSGSQRIGSGRRASTSTKKAIISTVLEGEIAASPDAESLENVTSPLGLPTPQVTIVPNTLIPTSSRTTSITSQGIGVGGYPINLKLNSILFGTGGGSTYFSQPNCSAEVFENYLKVKLTKDGYEKTEVDIWKESIDFIAFENERDLATGFPILALQARVGQYLSGFDQELLNPDRNDTLVMFKFINLNVNFRPSVTENILSDNNGGGESSSSVRNNGESRDLKTFLEKWLTTNNVIRIV